jgi:hypothetical protein
VSHMQGVHFRSQQVIDMHNSSRKVLMLNLFN